STGPKRAEDVDGPEAYHVILLDNGRSKMLGNEFREMLRCIRCGACLNHCPVYGSIGGHAYGSVYPGPMGSVLTPGLTSIEESVHLPQASTLCGKCEEVCLVRIPLPKLLRNWRFLAHDAGVTSAVARTGISFWAFFAKRPSLYHFLGGIELRLLAWLGRRDGRLRRFPGLGAWTKTRDFPAPEGATFISQWQKGRRS
ncbi:MAG: DUF3390 domain-containing protein, partial [Proteobacteria bacterium]|nr:DUF3390 domain-containing protein [Pseudomonadota bacterium]